MNGCVAVYWQHNKKGVIASTFHKEMSELCEIRKDDRFLLNLQNFLCWKHALLP